MNKPAPSDLLVLGGGVIGLSVAWEALRRGLAVTVIDQASRPGRASWAGAGILSPAHATLSAHPLERMAGVANGLHRQWAAELLAQTGIDNGYRECSGVYLAMTAGEAGSLVGQMDEWNGEGIGQERLDPSALAGWLGKEFRPATGPLASWLVREESQVRPPRHLKALAAAVRQAGGHVVDVSDAMASEIQFQRIRDRVNGVLVSGAIYPCNWLCLAAGAWSGSLAAKLGWDFPVVPVRGQMALFQCDPPPFQPIVNVGSRYLVPREDGLVLAGSTMEEAGFDPATTGEAIASLTEFAASLFPVLGPRRLMRSWSGLRPATFDGLPCIGFVPGLENALVATGHLRSGLQLSTATAVMIADLLEGRNVDPDCGRLLSPSRRLGVDERQSR